MKPDAQVSKEIYRHYLISWKFDMGLDEILFLYCNVKFCFVDVNLQ